ncbi:MAG: hypothetical protein HQL78_01065 [Magnetococcales bacterium]|nr:hypothetical protein [Magnetococcales bacterium]
MEQWGMNTMSKKASVLALAAAFTIGIGACGGGGGSSSSSSGTVAGVAIDGPVTSGSIIVYNADGTTCSSAATSSDSSAKFSLNLGSCTLPVSLELSGGTDVVHSNLSSTFPQPNMRSLIGSSTQTVANISPFSTLIFYSIVKGNGNNLTAAGVTTSNAASSITTQASTILKAFGFGADLNTDGSSNSSFDPITSILGTSNLATFTSASEALSETIRRVAKAAGSVSTANVGQLFMALGQDLSDGTLDGSMGSSTISSPITGFSMDSVRAYAMSNALFVLNEMFSSTGLTVTDQSGSQKSALAAIKTATTTVNSSATTSFDSVKPNSNLTSQWTTAKSTALTLLGKSSLSDLGISSDLTTSASISSRGALAVNSTLAAALADASQVATYSANVKSANNSFVSSSTFNVALSSITLTDYPSNTASTLTPSTPSVSSGVLTVTLPSTTTVSASNLGLLNSTSASSASATPPVLNFTLKNIPQGSGTAGVTMTLLDGSNSTRDSGERYISATFNLPWTSDGTTLTLKDASSASVSYYAATDTSASSASLSQSAVGSLAVTSSGTSNSGNSGTQTTLKMKIAELFNTASTKGNSALAKAMTSGTPAGSYYYSVSFSGISLAATDSSSNTSAFSSVQGTFTVK